MIIHRLIYSSWLFIDILDNDYKFSSSIYFIILSYYIFFSMFYVSSISCSYSDFYDASSIRPFFYEFLNIIFYYYVFFGLISFKSLLV